MPRRPVAFLSAAALLFGLGGCRNAATVSPGAVMIPTGLVIPEGTPLGLRLEQPLGLDISGVGNPFRATTVSLVLFDNGTLVVPAGTEVFGTVTGLVPPSDGHPGAIRLAFDRIVLRGDDHPLEAAVTRTDVAAADSADTARGHVLSGDLLAALATGPLGSGPGTAISLGPDPEAAVLPVGTVLLVTTGERVVLR